MHHLPPPRRASRRRGLPLHRNLPPVSHVQFYDALQKSLPSLMETRVKSWGQTGSAINPQQDSLFYNGRIPQEITDLIFDYALSASTVAGLQLDSLSGERRDHDFCVRYDHGRGCDEPDTEAQPLAGATEGMDAHPAAPTQQGQDVTAAALVLHSRLQALGFDWYRPEVAGKKVFPGKSLLLTCRRIYLDAAKFLARSHEVVIWQGREPRGGESFTQFARRLRKNYERPHLQRVHSMRVYAQMYQLETLVRVFNDTHQSDWIIDNNPESADSYWHLRSLLSSGDGPTEPVWRMFHNLQELHLTLRRTDWDRWEDNKPLAIDVHHARFSAPDIRAMGEQMRAALEGGEQPPFEKHCLGTMFRIMANLKKLTISFETSEDKKDEMEQIVKWARTWRFEIMSWRHWMIRDNHEVMAHLVCDPGPAQKMSWRGLRYHWSDVCPSCSTHISGCRNSCSYCRKREILLGDWKGPRLLMWTLTWRPVQVDPPISFTDTEVRKARDQEPIDQGRSFAHHDGGH